MKRNKDNMENGKNDSIKEGNTMKNTMKSQAVNSQSKTGLQLLVCSLLLTLALVPWAQASLIGQWTFNEGSGTNSLDSTANGNNGAISGGATYVASPGNYALHFDGTNGLVNMGTPALFNINGASARFTVEAWMKIDDVGTGEPGIGKPFNYGLTTSNPRLIGYVDNGGNKVTSTDSDNSGPGNHIEYFVLGQWEHVVLTYDATQGGTNMYLYINTTNPSYGELLSDWKLSGSLIGDNSAVEFTVGRVTGTGGNFRGDIDEVRLYDTALSAVEVHNSFVAGPSLAGPVPEPGTISLFLAASAVLGWRKLGRKH